MARFHINTTFEVPEHDLFVMTGRTISGSIVAGMHVHLPLNSQTAMTIQIHGVEKVQSTTDSDIRLCVRGNTEERELLRAMNIFDEDVEVT